MTEHLPRLKNHHDAVDSAIGAPWDFRITGPSYLSYKNSSGDCLRKYTIYLIFQQYITLLSG